MAWAHLGRGHNLPAAHGEGVQVPRPRGLVHQRAHKLHRARVEGRRHPVTLLVGTVTAAAGGDPNQLTALDMSRVV